MTAKEGGMGVHNSVRNHADWPRLARLTRDLAFLDGGSDTAFTLPAVDNRGGFSTRNRS